MNTLFASKALLVLAAVSSMVPAYAADGEDPLTTSVLLPVRAAALSAGIVVGIPASSIRQTARDIPRNTRAIADSFAGQDDPVSLAFAAIPGTATGLVQGLAEGFYYGTKNAVDNCVDRPFSSASFSLAGEED